MDRKEVPMQEEKQENFGDRMAEILNQGALNLAMGIGYRLGIFDVLDSMSDPETTSAIAQAANLDRRYLQEWLGVMVCGKIVDLIKSDDEVKYFLPKERGDLLASRAGSSCMGVYAQETPLLTLCAIEPVEECFRQGGGVDYGHYGKFETFMSRLADAKHERVLVETFLPSVDSGKLVERLKKGLRACDLGCGHGAAILLDLPRRGKTVFGSLQKVGDVFKPPAGICAV